MRKALQEITNPNDIKEKMTLLLIDSDNKIRGIDTIHSINRKDQDYFYHPYKTNCPFNNPYHLSFENLFKRYTVFQVEDNFASKYSDECLQQACLKFDYGNIFKYALYNEKYGTIIWSLLMKDVQSNIKSRIAFIDLANKYSNLLHILMFEETLHEKKDSLETQELKAELKNLY